MSAKQSPGTWIAIAIVLVLWASAFAGIRAGMRLDAAGHPGTGGYGPGELALLRFGVASLVLAVFAAMKRMRIPDLLDLPRLALAGFLGITIYHVALNYGEVTVNAGAASLLIAAGPVFTALLSMVFLHERLTWAGWGGIVLAFAGVSLISLSGGKGLRFTPGALLILLSAVATASYFILSKLSFAKYSALESTCYAIWAGTIPMFVFLPGLLRKLPQAAPSATLSVVYLGVFPAAIAYILWNHSLSRMPASKLTSFLYLTPVLAMLIAWAWLREIPAGLTLIGGAVAILGVVIVQAKGKIRIANTK
jgi:drug/metabolite transporter (DMT)-like permease